MEGGSKQEQSKKVALVLFSGGRDSSAAAVEAIKENYFIRLYTYQAGLPELTGFLGDSAPDIRHKELLQVFPQDIDRKRIIEGNTYLIRKLAIEKTNKEHVVYPIALALAVHTSAVCYCLKHKIDTVISGYSGYQAEKDCYIEQRDDFLSLTRKFLREYHISYLAPVIKKSESEVKDVLEKHGISSNSLENKSIWGGVDFDMDKALEYWESCIPICTKFIRDMQTATAN